MVGGSYEEIVSEKKKPLHLLLNQYSLSLKIFLRFYRDSNPVQFCATAFPNSNLDDLHTPQADKSAGKPVLYVQQCRKANSEVA